MLKNLRRLRKEIGMDQEPFASQFGIKKTTYSSYEAADVIPKVSFLKDVADKYHVTLDYLLDFCDDPHGSKYGDEFLLTLEEKGLVQAWRVADEKDRRRIAIDLEDYGFEYHPRESIDSEGAS